MLTRAAIKKLEKLMGKRLETFTIEMPRNKDIENYIKKIEAAHRRAARSKLRFRENICGIHI